MPQLKPIQKKEQIKVGRKVVAEVLTHKNGKTILVVNRTMKDIVRSRDAKMITHGMEDGSAAWPVETLLLSRMKRRGIDLLAVRVKANKAMYLSRFSSWLEHSEVYIKRKRNGSMQRTLTFDHFAERPGIIKL